MGLTSLWTVAICLSIFYRPTMSVAESFQIGNGYPGLKIAIKEEDNSAFAIYQDEPWTVGDDILGGMRDRDIHFIINHKLGFFKDNIPIGVDVQQLYPFDSNSVFTSYGGRWNSNFTKFLYIPRANVFYKCINGVFTISFEEQKKAESEYRLKEQETFLGYVDGKVFYWKDFNPKRVFWGNQTTEIEYCYRLPSGVIDIYGVVKGIKNNIEFVVLRKSKGLLRSSQYERIQLKLNIRREKYQITNVSRELDRKEVSSMQVHI